MSERVENKLREVRASQFAGQMMHLLRDHIPEESWRPAQETLYRAAYEAEIEVTTRDSRLLGALSINQAEETSP